MKHSTNMQNDIDNILGEIAAKDSLVLCREVLSIGDTMDVLLKCPKSIGSSPYGINLHYMR